MGLRGRVRRRTPEPALALAPATMCEEARAPGRGPLRASRLTAPVRVLPKDHTRLTLGGSDPAASELLGQMPRRAARPVPTWQMREKRKCRMRCESSHRSGPRDVCQAGHGFHTNRDTAVLFIAPPCFLYALCASSVRASGVTLPFLSGPPSGWVTSRKVRTRPAAPGSTSLLSPVRARSSSDPEN